MSFIIQDEHSLDDLRDLLSGKQSDNTGLCSALEEGQTISFKEETSFILKKPIEIRRPVRLKGNGAVLSGEAAYAFMISSSDVEIEGFVIDKINRAIMIDAFDQQIVHIKVHDCIINDPGFGVGVNIGSSESYGKISDVAIENCVFNSGYDEKKALEKGIFDGAMAFNVSAAAPASGRKEDLIGAQVDGLIIRDCQVLGPRRYGINMLVGVSIPEPGTDFMSQKAKIVDCAIRNVKVLHCTFDYCREMAVSLSTGCINNYGSKLENLEIAGCKVVYGICGVGFSGAGPIIPTSISRDMGMRHGSIHDNELILMDLPVGEPSRAINLTAARNEGFAGIEVYECYVEDVDIYNNTIINADTAIEIVCANSMGDEAKALNDNYVRSIRVYQNQIRDSRTAFCVLAAYAEGRRFDWNWGWRKFDWKFADLSVNHEPTIEFYRNSISDLDIYENDINGCANEIVAVAGYGRGHARFKDNRIDENISYHNNHFERSEGHRNVTGTYYSDWVKDDGGNHVRLNEK